MSERTTGIVYLVGAGPGDPGLLTLRGAELMVTADAVVFDALVNRGLLALATVHGREVEFHEVGKRGGYTDSAKQDDINALLIRLGREGKRVVRLKGGDPFVFGRGGEEALALAEAGVAFEVVPGVTAGVAAAAYAGIPVTHRRIATSVSLVTGFEDPQKAAAPDANAVDWKALARAGGTIVLYMGVKALPVIANALMEGGLSPDTPAAAIRWGTYPRQQTVRATLATLHDTLEREGIQPPVITVIGGVVALRDRIAWYDKRPLFGTRVVVTRAASAASALTERLMLAGADVIEMAATRIEPLNPAPLQAAITKLSSYDWAIFTSQNAVAVFWGGLAQDGQDARAFAGVRVAAVGPATAQALRARGIEVDLKPKRFVAEGLLEAFDEQAQVNGARMLYATAEGARGVLPDGLTMRGATVDRVEIYRSAADAAGAAELRDQLFAGDVHFVTFASGSAVRAFVDAVGVEAARAAAAVSIGPATSAAIREAGLQVGIEAKESTIPGLVAALIAHRRR